MTTTTGILKLEFTRCKHLLVVGSSYMVEINILGAVEAGEPVAVVPLPNAGVVEVEAELFDGGALLVPEGVAVWGVEASQLLVALEAVRAEKEVSVNMLHTQTVDIKIV